VAETLRADQDVRARLRSCGPDALTPLEALTVLLGERSLVPAGRLLAAFGSLRLTTPPFVPLSSRRHTQQFPTPLVAFA